MRATVDPPPLRGDEPKIDQAIHDRRWWTLAVLCLSLVLVVVSNTVLNVALPTLVQELDATASELQWIVDSYALVFAGLLLTAGALGDRYGRKGALQTGLLIFGLAAAGAAFGPIAGGWVLEHFWWGAVFLVNVPIVAVALLADGG